jgi:hypothetical protein
LSYPDKTKPRPNKTKLFLFCFLLVVAWRRQVGFHATGLQNETVDKGQPLIFNDVAYNSGKAYNASSGSFIVPVDGVYMFLATTMNGADFALNVDDTDVSRAVSYWAKHKHCRLVRWV